MHLSDWWAPAYICLPLIGANMLPVLWGRGARPIDQYRWWPQQWPLGCGKTLRGFLGGWLSGVAATILIAVVSARLTGRDVLLDIWRLDQFRGWAVILVMGFGALLGDLVESIIKRRLSRPSGTPWWPWDQLDAVIGGFALTMFIDVTWFMANLWRPATIVWIGVYLVCHVGCSRGAYALKIKSVPH